MMKKKEADDAVKEKQAEKKKYEKSVNDLQKEMVKAEEEISSLMREADVRKKKYEKAKQKVELIQGAVEELTRAGKFTMQNLSAAMLEKLPEGGRIECDDHNEEYYKKKIKALQVRKEKGLQELPVGQRDLPAAVLKAVNAKKVYDDKMGGLQRTEENNIMLQGDLLHRQKKWKRFRKRIARNADKLFDKTLQLKGQSGELIFDHETKELRLDVMKDNRDTQSQISNVKLLSGGERSYTTLALLMSLGDTLECPFRIMDEFDVFMDSVSRNVALDTLVEEGLRRKDRQFILITPQTVDSIVPGPYVKIIKLEPAKKSGGAQNAHGQQSLNFGTEAST
jgi:chromosome segregation ATPase